jgi:hypothetical protein
MSAAGQVSIMTVGVAGPGVGAVSVARRRSRERRIQFPLQAIGFRYPDGLVKRRASA